MNAEEAGRNRVAELVTAAMGWTGLSGPAIERTTRVSRATVDRVKRSEPVSDAMLRALGDVLDLPRDFLLYVRDGNRAAIGGVEDRDLVRWTLNLLDDAGGSGVVVNGLKPTQGVELLGGDGLDLT